MKNASSFLASSLRLKPSAYAIAACFSLFSFSELSFAASLGKITVFSHLADPLRAEIEVMASSEEIGQLKARLAAPHAARESGFDFTPTLKNLHFRFEERSGSKIYLKLSSDSPLLERFVDFFIEMSWDAGSQVKEYTFLLEPKPLPAPAQIETPSEKPRASSQTTIPVPNGEDYLVKPGDTLYKIARQNNAGDFSLDQMLVALYRANPHAFDGKNMNRLKAGTVLAIPKTADANELSLVEAKKEITAHTTSWQTYRQKVSQNLPVTLEKTDESAQSASGKITPKVTEKKVTPEKETDLLKVTRSSEANDKAAGNSAKQSEEDLIAKAKALKDATEEVEQLKALNENLNRQVALQNARLAELEKNAKEVLNAPKPPEVIEEKSLAWYERPLTEALALVVLFVALLLVMMRYRKGKNAKKMPLPVATKKTAIKADLSTAPKEEADVMSSVEIYLACGKDEQAIEVLIAAHEKDPKDTRVTLKLLEIYASHAVPEKFDALASELETQTGGAGEAWAQAAQMGRELFPGNPRYEDHSASDTLPEEAEVLALTSSEPEPIPVLAAASLDDIHGLKEMSLEAEMADEPAESVALDMPEMLMEDLQPEVEEALPEPAPKEDPEPLDFDLSFDMPSEPPLEIPQVSAPQAPAEEDSFAARDLDLPSLMEEPKAEETPLALDLPKLDISSIDLDLGVSQTPATKDDLPSLDELLPEPLLPDTAREPLLTEEAQVAQSMEAMTEEASAQTQDIQEDDVVATKLDLAKAYEEMGDKEGARELLQEVLQEGAPEQIEAAQAALARFS